MNQLGESERTVFPSVRYRTVVPSPLVDILEPLSQGLLGNMGRKMTSHDDYDYIAWVRINLQHWEL